MGRPRTDDLSGCTFGRWLVLSYLGMAAGRGAKYLCQCSCGVTKPVKGCNLRTGHSTSCGCWSVEKGADATRTHGEGGAIVTPEYRAYWGARTRCQNKKGTSYKYYGGRGIAMCQEWLDSYEAFLAHIGRKPSSEYTLDRIDVNGNYEPGNVRWATPAEQVANRRPFKHRNQFSRRVEQ